MKRREGIRGGIWGKGVGGKLIGFVCYCNKFDFYFNISIGL